MRNASSNKSAVEQIVTNVVSNLQRNTPEVNEQIQKVFAPTTQAKQEQIRQTLLHQLVTGLNVAQTERQGDPDAYVSRNPAMGMVQSSINSVLREEGMEDDNLPPGFQQYGPLDPEWAECIFEGLKTRLAGKAPFVQHKNIGDFMFPIADKCTIVLMADWGGNNHSAARVAEQIRLRQPDYVVHLGDIYYAGTQAECDLALQKWPLTEADGTPKKNHSFSLNGNHEMFCGGKFYFDVFLPALGQQASYFGLANASWQLLGLDTAYCDHRLLSSTPQDSGLLKQWEWLVDKIKNDGGRNTVLMTHHQPISAFDQEMTDAKGLQLDTGSLYNATRQRPIFAWFFGHEHRCTIYDDVEFSDYKARLIGNGCIPHARQTETAPDNGCIPFTAVNHGEFPPQSGVAISGFVVLKMDGNCIDVEYLNEDGSSFHQERWCKATLAAKAGA